MPLVFYYTHFIILTTHTLSYSCLSIHSIIFHINPPFKKILSFVLKFIFIFSCAGSLLPCPGFLLLWEVRATLPRGARVSHFGGLSRFRARAVECQASVVVSCGVSCPSACGIFPSQGANPCVQRWQADA